MVAERGRVEALGEVEEVRAETIDVAIAHQLEPSREVEVRRLASSGRHWRAGRGLTLCRSRSQAQTRREPLGTCGGGSGAGCRRSAACSPSWTVTIRRAGSPSYAA